MSGDGDPGTSTGSTSTGSTSTGSTSTGSTSTGSTAGATIGAGATTAGRPAGGGAEQAADIGKSAWFGGFKYTFGKIERRKDDLTVAAKIQNLGVTGTGLSPEVTFTVGDTHLTGYAERVEVPAGQTSDVLWEFDAEKLTGSITDGRLEFGDGTVNKTVVPVGAGPGLVTHEPRQILGRTEAAVRDLTFTISGCELRTDIVTMLKQARAGYRVIACTLDASYPGPSSFHTFNGDLFRLLTPDGKTVSPTDTRGKNLDKGVSINGWVIGFEVKEPVAGVYQLQIVDLHLSSEQVTPDRLTSVRITV